MIDVCPLWWISDLISNIRNYSKDLLCVEDIFGKKEGDGFLLVLGDVEEKSEERKSIIPVLSSVSLPIANLIPELVNHFLRK